MIEISLGKALVAVERKRFEICDDCWLNDFGCHGFPCSHSQRKDGKNVIFKLVDYPGTNEQIITFLNKYGSKKEPLTKEEVDMLIDRVKASKINVVDHYKDDA